MKTRFSILLALICHIGYVFADDAKLDSLLYKNVEPSERINNPAVTTSGYRVQIYSSNRAQIAKQGAFELEKNIKEIYPDLHTYVTYNAPFWKVRLGDFSSYYEALNFSNTIKEAFPDRATEVFVVKEDVIKPIYFDNKTDNTVTKLEETFN